VPALRGAALEGRRYSGESFDSFDGVLEDPDAVAWLAEHFGEDRVFSVSQVERYLGCPFGFFLERVLRVEEPPDPVERFEALERGSLVHRVLARLMERFIGTPLAEAEWAEVEAALREELDAAFAEERAYASPVMAALLRAERYALEGLLAVYLEFERDQAKWAPLALERAFGEPPEAGDGPAEEPLALETPSGTVRFMGKIDRIDTHDGTLRVADYKTGSPPNGKDIVAGRSVQLQVYTAAVRRLYPDAPCGVAEFVRVAQTPKTSGIYRDSKPKKGESNPPWDAAWENALAAIDGAVAGIREGRFPPTPVGGTACGACPGNRACRFERSRIERKPGVDAFADNGDEEDA
jgi:ATP-dependent helicase/nuclease subunit B